ncbi:MAG: 6-phospho-3-hexuloisomerase [Candidatus Pristimantibacillus sp.]
MTQIKQYAAAIVEEISGLTNSLPDDVAEALADAILEAGHIFVAGAGRSGLMGKAFAMRLMHMGFEAYVVGETVTKGFGQGDVLVLGSGSGKTESLIAMAGKATALGGTVAVVTTDPNSILGQSAAITVKLSASPKDASDTARATIQPMASLFEQGLLIFYDAVILRLMEKKGLDSGTMYGSHANLE